jgi:hypothetical protein
MKKGIRFLSSAMVAGALLLPVAMRADDHDRDDHHDHRYYDRAHKDYHNWDNREDQAYRGWYAERYHDRQYRDFNRLHRNDQQAYWTWRHEHPDNH